MLQRLETACKRAPNPGKRIAFEALARRALELAKFLCANIRIDMTTSVGVIVLESDLFMLDGMDCREYAQTVADLFTAADDILFFVPDHGLPEITFTFVLYDADPPQMSAPWCVLFTGLRRTTSMPVPEPAASFPPQRPDGRGGGPDR